MTDGARSAEVFGVTFANVVGFFELAVVVAVVGLFRGLRGERGAQRGGVGGAFQHIRIASSVASRSAATEPSVLSSAARGLGADAGDRVELRLEAPALADVGAAPVREAVRLVRARASKNSSGLFGRSGIGFF